MFNMNLGIFAATTLIACYTANAIDLSNNLTNATFSTEQAATTRPLAASFTTASSSRVLNHVTLLLSAGAGSACRVAIYTDSGMQPGTQVGLLTSPATFNTVLTPTTFTTSGFSLAANTTYWLVLTPLSGSFQWGWSAVETGTGPGFTGVWAMSEDSGAFWWSINSYSLQMRVVSDECSAPNISTNPIAQDVCVGSQVTFTAGATGNESMHYQWTLDGVNITDSPAVSGANSSVLMLYNAVPRSTGVYACAITRPCGTGASTSGALLTVCAADFNCDGGVDGGDVETFFAAWASSTDSSDINSDGGVDGGDVAAYFTEWARGGC